MHSIVSYANALNDDGLVIFLLHGVVEHHTYAVRNSNRKHLARAEFHAFLDALREQRGVPLSMDAVVAHARACDPFPPRAYAMTFDDGFENNASIAAPMLDARALPATFYVTTGWMGTRARSWVDRLEACLEYAPAGSVVLPWESRSRMFASIADRIALLDVIRAYVKSHRDVQLDRLAQDIFAQCGVDERATWSDPLDAKLSRAQVCALAAHPRFTVGGHTHTHAMLAFCSPEELDGEIRMSIRLLQEVISAPVYHYAYPEGLAQHYNDAVIAQLVAHGIVCCPTAIAGVNTHTTNLFQLRRIPVMPVPSGTLHR